MRLALKVADPEMLISKTAILDQPYWKKFAPVEPDKNYRYLPLGLHSQYIRQIIDAL